MQRTPYTSKKKGQNMFDMLNSKHEAIKKTNLFYIKEQILGRDVSVFEKLKKLNELWLHFARQKPEEIIILYRILCDLIKLLPCDADSILVSECLQLA